MTTQLTATEAKARLLALLDEAANGAEIEITKRGRTVARLVPAVGARSLRGCADGLAVTVDPEDELLGTGADWDADPARSARN